MGVLNYFSFNEIPSLEYNLVIESKSILNAPEPDLQSYQIPGRDGNLYISNNRWNGVQVSYDTFLRVHNQDDIQAYLASVKNWLLAQPGEYLRLEDTYDLEHYRLGTYVTRLEVENSWRWCTRQTVQFECLPYRYLRTGDISTISSQPITVYNPTGFNALPEITLYFGARLNDSFTIEIQDEDGEAYYQQTLTGVPASLAYLTLVINSQTQEMRDMYGNLVPTADIDLFPYLKPGTSVVNVTANNATNTFAITPHWREL